MPENFITPLPASTSLAGRLERLVTASVTITTELSLEGVLQGVANIAAEIIGNRWGGSGRSLAETRGRIHH